MSEIKNYNYYYIKKKWNSGISGYRNPLIKQIAKIPL